MAKKQKTEKDKALEMALKTDSEKKESAKKSASKKPELNEPTYDVQVDIDGNVDVISEEMIDEVEYPPELADFLSEILQNERERLGLAEGESFPEGYIQAIMEAILLGADPDALAEELARINAENKALEEEYTDPELEAAVEKSELEDEDEEDDDEAEEMLSDEMLAHIDYSKLEKDEIGRRILAEFTLYCPDKFRGIETIYFPIENDKEAVKNFVTVRINLPYLKKMKVYEAQAHPELVHKSDAFFIFLDDLYILDKKTAVEVRELTMKICDVEHGPINRPSVREDGYYDDAHEYWFDGKCYHEKDVIWFEIPRTTNFMGNMKGFSANLDSFLELLSPCDITNAKETKIEDDCRVLSNREKFDIQYLGQNEKFFKKLQIDEEVWYLASKFAKEKDTVGYCVVCLNGNFYVPVESFFNEKTSEVDDLIVPFNTVPCLPVHHRCSGLIVADVGNMKINTAIRYCNGQVFDWAKRVEQEIAALRSFDADYDPYDDPYGNPNIRF